MASAEDVKKLAALARLSIPDGKLETRAAEFDRIVSYIDQLNQLDLAVKTTTPAAPAHRNVFREDGEPTPSGTWTDKLIPLFPSKKDNRLEVKKILSQD